MLSFSEKKLQELNEESGENTWHAIAKSGNVEIIRKKYFDLDEAEINIKNKEGLTPFAIAFEKNNLEMVKELIKCGCEITNDEMLNFIGNAIEKNNLEMVKELIKCGCEITNDEMLNFIGNAIEKNNLEMVKELIGCGEEIPKEEMLNFIKNSIKNKNSEMNIYLISIFNKNLKSEVSFQGAVPANSSQKSIYDVPSCEPSSPKKIKYILTDYGTRSLS